MIVKVSRPQFDALETMIKYNQDIEVYVLATGLEARFQPGGRRINVRTFRAMANKALIHINELASCEVRARFVLARDGLETYWYQKLLRRSQRRAQPRQP